MWITHKDSFWDSFWAGLFSGAIYSILVGLVVGWILWRFQINYEKKQNKLVSQREYSVFRQRLVIKLLTSNVINMTVKGAEWLPANVLNSSEFMLNSPVYVWREHLTNRVELKEIELIQTIINTLSRFTIHSSYLDNRVIQILKKKYPGNYQVQLKAFYGVLIELNPDNLLTWLQVSGADINYHGTLIKDPELEPYVQQYKSLRNDLITHFQTLISLLEAEKAIAD